MDFDRKFVIVSLKTSIRTYSYLRPHHLFTIVAMVIGQYRPDCHYIPRWSDSLHRVQQLLLHCWHNDVTSAAVSTPTVRAPCTRRRAPAASLSRVFQPVFTRPCGRSLVLVFSPQGHVQASCFVLQTLARFAFLWFSWHRSLSSVFGQDRFTLSFFCSFLLFSRQ